MNEVEVKLQELRGVVDRHWEQNDIEAAMAGERLITSVKRNQEAVDRLKDVWDELKKRIEGGKR